MLEINILNEKILSLIKGNKFFMDKGHTNELSYRFNTSKFLLSCEINFRESLE